MRVSISDFRKKLAYYLSNLPVEITRDGVVVAQVKLPEVEKTVAEKEEPKEVGLLFYARTDNRS